MEAGGGGGGGGEREKTEKNGKNVESEGISFAYMRTCRRARVFACIWGEIGGRKKGERGGTEREREGGGRRGRDRDTEKERVRACARA